MMLDLSMCAGQAEKEYSAHIRSSAKLPVASQPCYYTFLWCDLADCAFCSDCDAHCRYRKP